MYHIKPDRRSRRTAEEISRGLLECLKEKPLSAVTVSDLHRVTGISRATFYRLFDNIGDVLEYLCAQTPMEELNGIPEEDLTSPARAFTRMLEQGLDNHDLLKALVDNGRYDLVYRYAEQRFRMIHRLYPGSLPQPDEAAYDYTVSALAMNMVAVLVTWVRRGRRESPEEVARCTGFALRTLTAMVQETEQQP